MGKIIALLATNEHRVFSVDGRNPFDGELYRKQLLTRTANQVVVVGLNTWKALGGKALLGRDMIVVTSAPEKFHDDYPETIHGRPAKGNDIGSPKVLSAYSFGDVVTFLKRRGDVRNVWVLGGLTLFDSAIGYIQQVQLMRFDRPELVEGDRYLSRFEHLFGDPQHALMAPDATLYTYDKLRAQAGPERPVTLS